MPVHIEQSKHDIDSTTYHTGVSGATEDNLVSFDSNGLPKDALVASNNVKKHNFTATSDPLPENDNTEGYSVGSIWWYPNAQKAFMCMNSETGSAVWKMVFLNGNVKNVSGDPITRGSVVYINGESSNKPTIVLAKADDHDTSQISGIILDDIADNGDGFMVVVGIVTRLNTSSFTAGTEVFLSAVTAGAITDVAPTAPDHRVCVGVVLNQHATQGIIHVAIDNGRRTIDLHDWDETPGSINGQTAMWDNDNSKWIISDAMIDSKDSGAVSWTGAGNYFDPTYPDGEFRLLRGGTGRIHGVEIPFSAPQDTGVLAANTTSFIYIDSSGNIQKTTTRTDALYEDNIVLFETLYDGTNYRTVRDDHPYKMDAATSNELHHIAGVVFDKTGGDLQRVTTGTGSVATDRQLKQVVAVDIHDHGIESVLSDSGGSGVIFNHEYTNGSGFWVQDSFSATFPMKYNNAGTPTAITTNRFGVFRLYLTKDNLNSSEAQLFSIMHTSQYTTLVQAQTAIANGDIVSISNELAALEMAQYGYIIVKNNASGGYIEEVIIEKAFLGGQTLSGGSSNQASLITSDTTNFDGNLSSSDTNVQAALETLDDIEHQFGLVIFQSDQSVTVGDGKEGIPITSKLAGKDIVDVIAVVHTKGVTGTTDIQIRRRRAGSDVDVLSTKVTIGDEWYANDGVVNTSNDDLALGDGIYIDRDAIHSGTAPLGLSVIIIAK
jgi:hypothetical protein